MKIREPIVCSCLSDTTLDQFLPKCAFGDLCLCPPTGDGRNARALCTAAELKLENMPSLVCVAFVARCSNGLQACFRRLKRFRSLSIFAGPFVHAVLDESLVHKLFGVRVSDDGSRLQLADCTIRSSTRLPVERFLHRHCKLRALLYSMPRVGRKPPITITAFWYCSADYHHDPLSSGTEGIDQPACSWLLLERGQTNASAKCENIWRFSIKASEL